MVFHNLWKEKMAICEKKSKKVRKSKGFFKSYVENHVGNVDKKHGIFPQKSVEKPKWRKIPFLGIYGIYFWKFFSNKDIVLKGIIHGS